jgi:hypothetical protein
MESSFIHGVTRSFRSFSGLIVTAARAATGYTKQRSSPRNAYRKTLRIEPLEIRATPSVTWWMDGTTLKMAGNSASDWMSVEIATDGRVWFNGTGMSGAQNKPASQVSAIDISGEGGNDNINVLQNADFRKPISIYGKDGNDTIRIDLRADGSAKYSVDGGNGLDSVTVPNWMPVGSSGFPSSFWTNVESRSISTLAQAQDSLRRNGDMASIWRQIQAPIINTPNNRTADNYRLVIEQFESGYYSHARYQWDSYGTKCNVFAGDVMRAMQAPLPTKRDLGTSSGTETAGAVLLNQWLNGTKTWSSSYATGPENGWIKIDVNSQADLNLLMAHVRAGKPALASTASPNHIAVIRPDQDVSQLTKDNLGSLVIAQAGAKNFNRGRLSDVDGWRDVGYQNVQFFIQSNMTTVQSGVPLTNITGEQGSVRYFKISVPAGVSTLEIKTYGGSGDADLYVRRDAPPTFSQWDHRPYLGGNNETVTVNNPAAGTYYVMLHGWSAYSGVSLATNFGAVTTIQNNVPISNLSGSQGSQQFFRFTVPAGYSNLTIQISGGSGDADLYVKRGSAPSRSSWDYRPYLNGNNETVTIANPIAGDWFIMLDGYTAFSGLTLRVSYY